MPRYTLSFDRPWKLVIRLSIQAKDQEKRARKKDKVEDGQKGASHQRKGLD